MDLMGTFIISDFTSTDTTAPIVRSAYAADSFSRPGPALGSTEIGGRPWAQNTGSIHQIIGNRMQLSTIPASSHAIAWFEDPHTNGVLTAKLASLTGGPNLGILVGYNPGTGTGYLLVRDSTSYTLRARAANGGLTTIATATGLTPAIGDILEMEVNGTQLTARVNGAQILNVTNNVYAHGIGKGVWAFSNGGSTTNHVGWDDISWSEA